jgi:hypothetical protein
MGRVARALALFLGPRVVGGRFAGIAGGCLALGIGEGEVQLRRPGHSQVQLGNEENGGPAVASSSDVSGSHDRQNLGQEKGCRALSDFAILRPCNP